MARLAKALYPSSFSIKSPMRGRAPPSSPPSAFQGPPMPEAPQTTPFRPRRRPLSKLSLSIFRLLQNHSSFHQEDESWRTRLELYKLAQQIIGKVMDAVEEEPLMFSKKERRQKDGKEVAMELGLGELVFADKVSFQSPVEDAEREYFTGQRSPTKTRQKNGKPKSTTPEKTDLNTLATRGVENLTRGLDLGSENGSEKALPNEISIGKNAPKALVAGRVKRQTTTKAAHAVPHTSSTMVKSISPGLGQDEEQLQQHIAPERVTRSRRGIKSRATAVRIEKQAPTCKNTQETRAITKAELPEEVNIAAKGAINNKRAVPLERSMQGLLGVTSPISQKTRTPPQVKLRKIAVGDVPNESVVDKDIIPQTRTLRSSKRLAGPKGGVEERAKGLPRGINRELQTSSEAMTGAPSGEMGFNFRRLSAEVHGDSTSASKTAGEDVKQSPDALQGFSVVIEKMPVNGSNKVMGNSKDNDVTGPALKPTIVRRSSRSTKGLQKRELAPSAAAT